MLGTLPHGCTHIEKTEPQCSVSTQDENTPNSNTPGSQSATLVADCCISFEYFVRRTCPVTQTCSKVKAMCGRQAVRPLLLEASQGFGGRVAVRGVVWRTMRLAFVSRHIQYLRVCLLERVMADDT